MCRGFEGPPTQPVMPTHVVVMMEHDTYGLGGLMIHEYMNSHGFTWGYRGRGFVLTSNLIRE